MAFDIKLGAYAENEDFLCRGDAEPHIRSQNIIFYSASSRWHIKVTFKGNTITGDVEETFIKAQKIYSIRRQQLRAFIPFIRFECLPLLEDTVTEVEFGPIPVASRTLPLSSKINELPVENGYHQFVDNLYYQVWEDPSRTRYPSFVNDLSVPTTALAGIKTIAKIAPGISRVNISSDPKERCYIFKSIDKQFYKPRDTKVLEQELQNLKLFRQSTIVQLISVVISTNPYHTGKSEDSSSVLRGFLLEYHPGGTLEDALREKRVCPGSRKWPVQIARGLEQLHRQTIAHMDLKPSNVVIGINDDAVIVDISGIAATKDWLAPEMREVRDPISLPWEARRRNDIWAYGTLLSMMVQLERDEEKARLLHEVIEETRKGEPSERLELCHVIRKLEKNLS
jgi:tRNA A-37 threonylcarbamoyl transferase component Bud32